MSMKANTIAKRSIVAPPGAGGGEIPSDWVTDPIEYDAGNAGDGLVTGFTVGESRQEGNYEAVCTDIGTPALWDVLDPYGVSIGTATTGIEFSTTEITFTIGFGATPWAVDDLITFPVRDASWIPYFGTGEDGDLVLTADYAIPNITDEICVMNYSSVTLNGFTLSLQNPGYLCLYCQGDIDGVGGVILRGEGINRPPTSNDLYKLIISKRGSEKRYLPITEFTNPDVNPSITTTEYSIINGNNGSAGLTLGMSGIGGTGGLSGFGENVLATVGGCFGASFLSSSPGTGGVMYSEDDASSHTIESPHTYFQYNGGVCKNGNFVQGVGYGQCSAGGDSVSSILIVCGGNISNIIIDASGNDGKDVEGWGLTSTSYDGIGGGSSGGSISIFHKGSCTATMNTTGGKSGGGSISSNKADGGDGGDGFPHTQQLL